MFPPGGVLQQQAVANNLLTNLESWWNLDETGTITTWADETANANDLTNSSGISTATAKYGTAADFVSTTGAYASIDPAGTGLATTTEDFSMCCWLYTTSNPGANTWATCLYRGSPSSTASSTRDFTLGRYSTGANNFYFNGYNGSNSTNVNSTVANALSTWFFIAAYYDYSADTIAISVNGETIVTNSTLPLKINTNQTAFNLGRGPTSGASNNWYIRGYLDNVAFWNNRVLTQDEVNWLYNSGNGRQFSELA